MWWNLCKLVRKGHFLITHWRRPWMRIVVCSSQQLSCPAFSSICAHKKLVNQQTIIVQAYIANIYQHSIHTSIPVRKSPSGHICHQELEQSCLNFAWRHQTHYRHPGVWCVSAQLASLDNVVIVLQHVKNWNHPTHNSSYYLQIHIGSVTYVWSGCG